MTDAVSRHEDEMARLDIAIAVLEHEEDRFDHPNADSNMYWAIVEVVDHLRATRAVVLHRLADARKEEA